MSDTPVMLITGTSRGIGRYLAEHYAGHGYRVIGCSRNKADFEIDGYVHFATDVSSEPDVITLFARIRKEFGRLDVLLNNAGIASMNHLLLTPVSKVREIFEVNVIAAFLFCREAAKLMRANRFGRIVNFTTVATPLKLEGEAAYAASKAAIVSLTQIAARELAELGITVNAVGPTPIETDLTRAVPRTKLDQLVQRQAIRRMGELRDVANVVDFFIRPESDFITGQVIFLGGV
ncbi:MAG TPA: SDR family oxidoreductase [Thermoanaerobaculia bacterium]|nr:SDR family oxidoreductase [Thermoanaerobaculia bacterium]